MTTGSEPKKSLEAMPREQFEQYVSEFIESNNVCVLGTAQDNIPRATPLEYEAEGTTLYIMVDRGRKIDNMKANPNISVVINNPLHGWLTVKGLQITSRAILITDSDSEYVSAWKIFNRANSSKEGWDIPPKGGTLLKVVPQKMELTESALKDKGYKMKQVWEA